MASVWIQQLINGISLGSLYALIALGYTMVYGILRLVNFAHGEIYMVGAITACYLSVWLPIENLTLRLLLILLLSMAASGVLGVVIERVAYRPLRQAPRVQVLITAIGVSLLLQYGGQRLFGTQAKHFKSPLANYALFDFHGIIITNLQVVALAVTLVLMLVLQRLIQTTQMGKAMRAVSFSHATSQLMGIPVNRIIAITFLLGSLLAGAAGVLMVLLYPQADPLMGLMPGLKAFVAAVLGGVGSIPGAVLGGLLMGLSETLVVFLFSSSYRDAIAFVLLIFILAVKPTGILGNRIQDKV